MKTRIPVLFLMSTLVLLLVAGPHLAVAQNLLKNPSFEVQRPDGTPVFWRFSGAPDPRWSIDHEVKHSGNSALKVVGENVTERHLGLYYGRPITLAPGVYRFSGWLRAENLSFVAIPHPGYMVRFHAYVAGTAPAQTVSDPGLRGIPEGSYDWTYFEDEFSVPCPVTLHPCGPSGFNGTLWCDDVSLELIKYSPIRTSPSPRELVRMLPEALHSPDSSFAVLFAPPVKKTLRAMKPDAGGISAGPRTSLSLARNEHEGVQVIIAPLTDATFSLKLSTSALREPATGTELAGASVTVRPVGYIGYDASGKLVSEPWPDPLLEEATVFVEPGKLQPLWVDVFVPEQADSGATRLDNWGLTAQISCAIVKESRQSLLYCVNPKEPPTCEYFTLPHYSWP